MRHQTKEELSGIGRFGRACCARFLKELWQQTSAIGTPTSSTTASTPKMTFESLGPAAALGTADKGTTIAFMNA